MKTIRILPIAVATALFAVGSATQAFADPSSHGDRDFTPPSYNTQATTLKLASAAQMPASSSTSQAGTWRPGDRISLSQAEKLAIERVGGKVVKTRLYGWGDHNYAIDLKVGNHTKRVYVNGKTGRLKVAINTDPAIDPAVIGGSTKDKEYVEDTQG